MIYLDTSALLKLYIREEGSEQVQATISSQDEPIPIWEMQETEFMNALYLKVFWKDITLAQARKQIVHFKNRLSRGIYYSPEIHRSGLMQSFQRLCEETHRLGCRTMDILHVACAIEIGATRFMTFDQRQRELASFAGLAVHG